MPAKGKHRRPKPSSSLTRGFVAAGTGGAALALPLIGATGAHAVDKGAAPVALPQEAPKAQIPQQRTAPQAQQPQKAAPQTDTRTYSVVSGDSLSKIAADEDVRGGWQKVYSDNEKVVGEDPSLIFPGMKLTLGGKAPAGSGSSASAASDRQASAPVAQQQKTERVERTEQRAEQRAEKRVEKKAESRRTERQQSKSSGFSAPVPSGVSTPYRASGGSWSSGYHTGVDFRASSGTPVKAVGAGTVVSAGWGGAYGNEVVIRHNDGRYSQYAHLSVLNVRSGQGVSGGQQIGYSGSTGNSTGPHLHFEIRTGPGYGSDIDPLGYLRSNGVPL
ncbi:LysM peptidoglycan-binding domain-containing M23 family metallopeptidase [Streptomyces sp. NBC_00237]|uniref:M23 family metallopeptidase n=1 Tax=Streptomyces sp. NBC_00237 TaxID=2975687 RepID=UPI00224D1ECD|nr:LysM peptidoglycan-binding domain-containing M23 family metallopeptidase [Streptomyces sp. NBC_00237]MCX5202858.1 LysM peptidoglycan-binding domain-containing M23 family metallopeptidase [Streptomyces sp. NBC_00237]